MREVLSVIRRFVPNKTAFTLAELIVVVTILAVLVAIGFVSLSGYSQDAADSRTKANVRSVYSAVSAESALTGNSPRYYVVHDSGASLSGGFAFVDGNPSVLTGGQYGTPGTNYSAGNPDWPKLKLNPEKFRISGLASRFAAAFLPAEAAYDPSAVLLAAAELATPAVSGKPRSVSYVQAAGIPASGIPFVVGNYPVGASGSVTGLLKDPSSPSATWALTDGSRTSVLAVVDCAASTQVVNGHSYSVPAFAHWSATSQSSSAVPVPNGTLAFQQDFICSNGTVSTSGTESGMDGVCDPGYSWDGSSCTANAWSSGAWGTCSGETGTWWYSAWGTCSATCWGGNQSRTATCARNSNGTQSRTVRCLKYDGTVLADADCPATKPGTSQSCTQGTDAVCWTAGATSQACNTQSCNACYQFFCNWAGYYGLKYSWSTCVSAVCISGYCTPWQVTSCGSIPSCSNQWAITCTW